MANTYMKTTDLLTDKWLKANGFNPRNFAATDILLLQALKAANTALKSHGDLLDQTQTMILNQFRLFMASKADRAKLKAKHAYKVLNISTAINRKSFKQRKRIQKLRAQTQAHN